MKRFFCDTCQRLRRVRRLPPLDQRGHGECRWHDHGDKTRAEVMARERRTHVFDNVRRPAVTATPKKGPRKAQKARGQVHE